MTASIAGAALLVAFIAVCAALLPTTSGLLPPGPVLVMETCGVASVAPIAGLACPLPAPDLPPLQTCPPGSPWFTCEQFYVAAAGASPFAPLPLAVCAPDCGGVPGLGVGGAVFPAPPVDGDFRLIAWADDEVTGLRTGVVVCQDLDGDRLCGEPGEPLDWACGHIEDFRVHGGVPVVVAVVSAGAETILDQVWPYHCQGTAGSVWALYAPLE